MFFRKKIDANKASQMVEKLCATLEENGVCFIMIGAVYDRAEDGQNVSTICANGRSHEMGSRLTHSLLRASQAQDDIATVAMRSVALAHKLLLSSEGFVNITEEISSKTGLFNDSTLAELSELQFPNNLPQNLTDKVVQLRPTSPQHDHTKPL